MKLFLLLVGLIVSANAAVIQPADKVTTETSTPATVEYVKAPTPLPSSTQATQQASTSEKPTQEDAIAAAAEYFKAPEAEKAEETASTPAAPVVVPTNVTHHAAVPVVPMSEFIVHAKSPEERALLQKTVEAWRKYKQHLYAALGHCQVLHNVSAAVSDKLMNIELEQVGPKEQCYVQCVLENLGEYKAGKVQADNMRESVGLIVGMQRLNKVLDKCQHIEADNLCASAYKFFECYRQSMFDFRSAEDNPLQVYAWVVQ